MTTPNVTPNSFKRLVGLRVSKTVDFCGAKVSIEKLSVAQVEELQKAGEAVKDQGESAGLTVLQTIIEAGAPEARELTDDEFRQFPIDELNNLANAIMSYSGMGEAGK